MAWANNDYVEVAERIRAWHDRYEDARITTDIVEFTEARVTVRATVYRGESDVPAGIGHSYLGIPGTTNFTRGSELENAETSAVGRALVMAGIPAKNIASTSEIRNKQGVGESTADRPSRSSAQATQDVASPASSEAGGVPETSPASDAPSPDDHLNDEQAKAIRDLFGGHKNFQLAAQARFGEHIRRAADLTVAQANELKALRQAAVA